MAYKNVTTGLTDINAVINELVTFMTTDLPQPWTLEYNDNPTAGNASDFDTSNTRRRTCLSIVPSQANVPQAFHDSRFPVIPSPLPSRIYIRLRNQSSSAISLMGSGYSPAGFSSPNPRHFGSQGDGQDWYETRALNLASTSTKVDVFVDMGSTGPFTQMWMFGPNQTSPMNPKIPNYVHFVVEYQPGRYVHGGFGEERKFVPFAGGWAIRGHARGGVDTVDASNNYTMWNQANDANNWCSKYAAEVGQRQSHVSTANARSPEPTTKWWRQLRRGTTAWANEGTTSSFHNMLIWGHTTYRNWMTGSSVSKISGFVPLATPIRFLLDEQASVGITDTDGPVMPCSYPPDTYLGDITTFDPGVEISLGGIALVPFPITSKLGTSPRSNYGGYFYRKIV